MPEIADVVDEQLIEPVLWGNEIRDRTVMRYSSLAALTSSEPSPEEGAVRSVAGDLYVYRAAPNAGWWRLTTRAAVSWSPVLRGSTTNPGLGGGGTATGSLWYSGSELVAYARWNFGTSPSGGAGNLYVNLPTPAPTSLLYAPLGHAEVYDASTGSHGVDGCVTYLGSTDAVVLTPAVGGQWRSAATPILGQAAASGDFIAMCVRYPLL